MSPHECEADLLKCYLKQAPLPGLLTLTVDCTEDNENNPFGDCFRMFSIMWKEISFYRLAQIDTYFKRSCRDRNAMTRQETALVYIKQSALGQATGVARQQIPSLT